MKCEACGAEIRPRLARRRFCGSKCRTAGWVRRKEQAARAPLELALRRVAGLLEEAAEEARAALKGENEG